MKKLWMAAALLAVGPLAGVADEPGQAADSPEAQTGAAPIYRTTDEQGNVVFTDQRPKDQPSEEVELQQTNTMPASKPVELPQADEPDDKAREPYRELAIVSPEPEATIRNPTEPVAVSVDIEPALKEGDQLVLLDNGQEVDGMSLTNPDRGAHSLQVRVKSEDGEVLLESDTITVYVHRSTVSDFQNANGGGGSNGGAANVGGAASRGQSAPSSSAGAEVGQGASSASPAQRGTPVTPASPAR